VSIEIDSAPNLYSVEFKFLAPHLGISVVLPATCALAAKLAAWELFPEYKSVALATLVFPVRYVEVDWQCGRCIVKKKKLSAIQILDSEDVEIRPKRGKTC